MQESKKIAWKRILAEGMAIVLSILIAFWIDAWWGDQVERRTLLEYLKKFETELVNNDELLDNSLVESAEKLLALNNVFWILSDADSQDSPETFQKYLGNSLWFFITDVEMSSFADLANSGAMRLVRDDRLSDAIKRYKWSADSLHDQFQFQQSTYNDILIPLLFRYTVLSDLWPEYTTNLESESEDFGKPPASPYSIDVEGLRSQEAWNALFSWKILVIEQRGSVMYMKNTGLELHGLLQAEIEFLSR
jgi:hypothetical protein